MSVDFNNSLESAFEMLMNQIAEAYELVRKIWFGDPCRAHEENRNKLEATLRDAYLAIEILNSYDWKYDRFQQHCYGYHPGRYEIQCQLCDVEQSCSKESIAKGQVDHTPPPHPRPWAPNHAIKPFRFKSKPDAGKNDVISENCSGVSDD
ncbi:MAG: hypothetical protein ACLQPD_35305 [Desulfomonilaceae bacterium]